MMAEDFSKSRSSPAADLRAGPRQQQPSQQAQQYEPPPAGWRPGKTGSPLAVAPAERPDSRGGGGGGAACRQFPGAPVNAALPFALHVPPLHPQLMQYWAPGGTAPARYLVPGHPVAQAAAAAAAEEHMQRERLRQQQQQQQQLSGRERDEKLKQEAERLRQDADRMRQEADRIRQQREDDLRQEEERKKQQQAVSQHFAESMRLMQQKGRLPAGAAAGAPVPAGGGGGSSAAQQPPARYQEAAAAAAAAASRSDSERIIRESICRLYQTTEPPAPPKPEPPPPTTASAAAAYQADYMAAYYERAKGVASSPAAKLSAAPKTGRHSPYLPPTLPPGQSNYKQQPSAPLSRPAEVRQPRPGPAHGGDRSSSPYLPPAPASVPLPHRGIYAPPGTTGTATPPPAHKSYTRRSSPPPGHTQTQAQTLDLSMASRSAAAGSPKRPASTPSLGVSPAKRSRPEQEPEPAGPISLVTTGPTVPPPPPVSQPTVSPELLIRTVPPPATTAPAPAPAGTVSSAPTSGTSSPAPAPPPLAQLDPITVKREPDTGPGISSRPPPHKLKKAWLQRHAGGGGGGGGDDSSSSSGGANNGNDTADQQLSNGTAAKPPSVKVEPPPAAAAAEDGSPADEQPDTKPPAALAPPAANSSANPTVNGDGESDSSGEQQQTNKKPVVRRKKVKKTEKYRDTKKNKQTDDSESESDKVSDVEPAPSKDARKVDAKGKKKRGRKTKEKVVKKEPKVEKKEAVAPPPPAPPKDDPFKRPPISVLKKTGESFLQDLFCSQLSSKLPKCRECRTAQHQRDIYCRFTAFRRLRYTRSGVLSVAGFCDPETDASEEDKRLWLPSGDPPAGAMQPEVAEFLLTHVGNQFCDLVQEEQEAQRCHMNPNKTLAWKRVVQGCREMCDVCETTLFNMHWVCSKCGFAVCIDCYRFRKEGTAKVWGEPGRDRDRYQWMLCSTRQSHDQQRLMLTQIVAGDALSTLNRQVHEARLAAGLPLNCQCAEARRLQQQGPAVRRPTAGGDAAANGAKSRLEDYRPGGSPLTWLADVALSDSKKNSDVSNSDTDTDEEGAGDSSTLRKLLVRTTNSDPTSSAPATDTGEDRTARKERKKGGGSMDTLDEVLNKVTAGGGGGGRSEDAADGSAAGSAAAGDKQLLLKHFVRRNTSKRGMRERLPIRIMTLSESTRQYPDVAHAWLCDGKLLRLLSPSSSPAAERLFRDQWKRGQPIICSNIGQKLNKELWTVQSFIRDFGEERNDLVNCRTGNIVPNQPMRAFWEGFECVAKRLRDDKGQPMILKLKDWPPGEDFAIMMPSRFADLMDVLPMTDYTRRDGKLNLASCLPDCFVRPDLGPKMYIAYGCALHPSKASTNLHLDVSDAVNIMVHVGIPPDGDADNAEALRAIDDAGCDQLTKRRVKEELPGALWHIYHASDADKIRDLLNKVAIERGDHLEPHHDPIHDQSWYLDGPLRRRLYEEYAVEGYPIVQCAGDAVFIPAGAPHQVRNLHSCIKVAEDFVSPENIGHCFDLTQEFRTLSDTHTNHEDKLQIKNIIYHAMKDAVSCLLLRRPADSGGGGDSSEN